MITIKITEETTDIQNMIYCLEEVIKRLENGCRISFNPNFTIQGEEEKEESQT